MEHKTTHWLNANDRVLDAGRFDVPSGPLASVTIGEHHPYTAVLHGSPHVLAELLLLAAERVVDVAYNDLSEAERAGLRVVAQRVAFRAVGDSDGESRGPLGGRIAAQQTDEVAS